jgi:hypothetical protein
MGSEDDTLSGFFANYSEYNKALRTWFVTFGLGGPSLFLINENLARTLKQSGHMHTVLWPFLSGCVLQILIAIPTI